jgi:CHAT domain-containing protein/tetratricopeptide (TPR) repeat protein
MNDRRRRVRIPPTVTFRRRGWTPVLGATLLWVAIGQGCVNGGNDRAPGDLMAELTRELESMPATGPRLTVSPEPGRCAAGPPASGRTIHPTCTATPADSPSERMREIALHAARASRERVDPEAMHVAALTELLAAVQTGKSLQRAISSLHEAIPLADRPAPLLADLSAAYLLRAEGGRTSRDLPAAIEAAATAVELEPRNPVARFNLALALQQLGLVEGAASAWRDYLAADSRSPWADEARRKLHEVLGAATRPPPPAVEAPAAAYGVYAAADPQEGRIIGWCRLLGTWGTAVLAGDSIRAEAGLRRAEAIAGALERRPGGDRSLGDGVRAIRAAHGPARQRLARAHRDFGTGCEFDERVELRTAARHFEAAEAAADGSPALRAWARLLYASMRFYDGDSRAGERIFGEVAAEADPVRHPALAGRARLLLAALLLRDDRYDAALDQAREAAPLFSRAGEREHEGTTLDIMSVAQFALRDMDAGYALAHAALERMQPYRSSYRLHNLLSHTGQTVGDDGFPRAALWMKDEGVRVAERTGAPVFVAEAHLARARLLAAAGRAGEADRDVAAGYRAVQSITDSAARRWMTAQWQMARAATSLRARPLRAAAALDSAGSVLLERAPLVALPLLVGGAQARLAAGDTAGGTSRLEAALALLEARRDSVRMEPRRAAVFETARAVVDQVALLKLAAGRPTEALRYLDRGRASLAPAGPSVTPSADTALAAPPGETVLEYALIGDALFVWSVAGTRVELFRTNVDRSGLVRAIERLSWRMEHTVDEEELLPDLSRLYDLLIGPIAGRLGEANTPLVVVADGEIAAVPFAALYDARRKRYLAEDHALRLVPSLRAAWHRKRPGVGAGAALFIADPAFDRRAFPAFERLPGSAAEVGEIAPGYPGRQVLSGPDASRRAVLAGLGRAGAVHYAGHAVFEDERPERSYLLLAPEPGRPGPATLEAADIAQLDLHHVALVVLSACRTVRTGEGRAAGLSGLAGAFLAAGAGGTVGSLWEVDDAHTRAFMAEFHRAYRATGQGPAALREAQLRLLSSGVAGRRSPAVWAAFQYVGS